MISRFENKVRIFSGVNSDLPYPGERGYNPPVSATSLLPKGAQVGRPSKLDAKRRRKNAAQRNDRRTSIRSVTNIQSFPNFPVSSSLLA